MKSLRSIPVGTIASTLTLGCVLSACAVPATQVEVPTRSMRDALEQSRNARGPALLNATVFANPPGAENTMVTQTRASQRSTLPPGVAIPAISAPDVRMAYLYEWIDRDGNQHFGTWVAIPLTGFDWILNKAPPASTPAAVDPSPLPEADAPSSTPPSVAPSSSAPTR